MSKIIVANFKMNGNKEFVETYFHNINVNDKNTIVICPPFPYLSLTKSLINTGENHNIYLGAQNCHSQNFGAFTGEVSTSMLADIGCKYVIIGHSERRQQQGETDLLVYEKVIAALTHSIIPIVCVGESLQQREQGLAYDIVCEQLRHSTPHEGHFMIAYEPIWAIGTGMTPTEADIQEMHNTIRQAYPDIQIKILYGGSVTAENASMILSIPHVNGVLVGGASLKIDDFNTIAMS